MKSILLIGSSGFIGKSLISYILKNEKDINIIYYISRTLTKIEESSARLKKIEVDILKLNKIPEVDGVIYLINSNDYKRGLKIFYKFKTLINKFKKKPKILYLSSGAIYGQNSSKRKLNEKCIINERKINQYSNYKKEYALEKKYLEDEFKQLSNEGFKVSIARCFNFVGTEMEKENFIISKIIKAIKFGVKIIVSKSKNTYRSYMHTDDMGRWLIKILNSSEKKLNIYNVGYDRPINLHKLCMYLKIKFKCKNIIFNEKKINSYKLDNYIPTTNREKKKLKLKYFYTNKNAILEILKNI